MNFKSGFVAIIGKPNAGKSTLLNALIGEKISIITSKAQTTRHRIKGILTSTDYQIVFSDTPGVIDPVYELHKSMMKAVDDSKEDADVLVYLVDASKPASEIEDLVKLSSTSEIPVIVAINKCDVISNEEMEKVSAEAKRIFGVEEVIAVSSLQKTNLEELLKTIVNKLPEQQAFFGADELTDKSERFLVAEMVREKIFEQFHQEIPYSTEVIIQDWKDEPDITKIRADIIVERESQKAILLGKNGSSIKQLGIESRKSIEEFLNKKIFIGLTIKVNPDWRKDPNKLKYFGY
ncbi:MAG: GTPase Era [Chitinophagales bacterium]|nr:GTPase Era [Chitinophagales bacterium]